MCDHSTRNGDQPFDLLIHNLSVCLTADPARATQEDALGRIADAAIGVRGDRLVYVGPEAGVDAQRRSDAKATLDARGAVAMPGLIDSHTHPVFGGSREEEFARRISGVPYMQIAAEGGGINATVRATRAADEDALYRRSRAWLEDMLRLGVTTVEAKSGYGLTTESELKQLRVIGRLRDTLPMRVVPTFMGAHEFPPEYKNDPEGYVDLVIDEMLPAVVEQGIARFCDVFCEEGVFNLTQTSRILIAASEHGLGLRLHADEFVDSGGALVACEVGAIAADHLMAVSPEGMAALHQSDVVAGLLPATSYYLGLQRYAPARALIEAGVRVALASDFNPGSAVFSNLQWVANMGCTQLRMSFEEVVLAVTRHAAAALALEYETGSLVEGLSADVLLLDIPRPEYLVYHVGRNHAWTVVQAGRVAWRSESDPVFLS